MIYDGIKIHRNQLFVLFAWDMFHNVPLMGSLQNFPKAIIVNGLKRWLKYLI